MNPSFAQFAAGLLLMAGSLQANALDVTTNLGSLPVVPPATVVSGTISHPVESFSDVFNFSLPTPGLSVLLADFEIRFHDTAFYDISGLTADLFNGFGASGSSLANLGVGVESINANLNLPVGDYSIRVVGNAVGAQGGIYAYAFAATVPEVQTWAMMLVGAGLVGLRLRRRAGRARAIRA